MAIGALGDIAFEASVFKILTFDKLKRTGKGRWTEHNIIGEKPKLEFLGPSLEEINLDIHLNSLFNVIPEDELQRLRHYRDTGEVLTFVLGNKVVGKGKYVIMGVDETHTAYSHKGKLIKADASISLKEYV